VGDLPPEAARFGTDVADDLLAVARASLVGVYLHGSAVLGDFSPLASDIDMLVVLVDDVRAPVVRAVAEVLNAARPCPGRGLEVSAVRAKEALRPREPWPFLVHVCTIPDDWKVAFGIEEAGDPDLVLHYLVARRAGVALVGPPPTDTIGEISAAIVLEQLANELRWAVRHASGPYAVLNACRALRYRADNIVCSKIAGGEWAMTQDIEPALVQCAVDARRTSSSYDVNPTIEDWVLHVAQAIVR